MSKLNWWKTSGAMVLLCAAAAIALPAQTFKTLVDFNGTNGNGPEYASLVQGENGNLYGTTAGGANNYGTIFEITPAGALTTLYWFCSQPNCADGSLPDGLVLGSDGNFYGTTDEGGNVACSPINYGCGTVFKMTPAGALTTLHIFDFTDGAFPVGALVEGSDGGFYGTTMGGGRHGSHCVNGCGTLFRITRKGALTTLHTFDYTDGANPIGALVQAADGSFYSTTSCGGAYGGGTIFRIAAGSPLTTIYNFCSQALCTDGQGGEGMIQATDGNFYGTTFSGGSTDRGTVFVITPSGTLTTVHSFDGTDGWSPTMLTLGTQGNLYGATNEGGANYGTIFEITAGGMLTTLHDFEVTDGSYPTAPPVEATSGKLYGTTTQGGVDGYGTVFLISGGLGSFVKTLPTVGYVGRPVTILGTKLTGATSVTFNGMPATFTAVSHSAIKTTVPAGATTRTVQVVTPSGTLLSNVPFRVVP